MPVRGPGQPAADSCGTAESFARYDGFVIATAQGAFRDIALYRDVPLVVDARNVIAPLLSPDGAGPRRLVKP